MPSLDDLLLEATVRHYIRSHDFNGLPLRHLSPLADSETALRGSASNLVRNGQISCAFASISINPHIKRLPDLKVSDQLKLLDAEPFDQIVCYPTEEVIRSRIDPDIYDDRPFTKRLALGVPQLEYVGFEL